MGARGGKQMTQSDRVARPVEFIPFSGQLGLWNLPARLRRRLPRA
jgi:hypothetical protein